jgi:hypothetical protein
MKMKATNFKPSIHGWPFGNSWTKLFLFDAIRFDMGFCGGMCWRAQQRYFHEIPIPRDLPQPNEGDDLFEELWDAQVDSVPLSTIEKIYKWQRSPELSDDKSLMGNLGLRTLKSLGHRTHKAWPKVKKRIDGSKPVTITLIGSSKDTALSHLGDSHRVVAYAYNVTDPDPGAPSGADDKVTLMIYDPNYPNRDDVELTFYLGAKRSEIRLNHNLRDKYYGFFKDDKN